MNRLRRKLYQFRLWLEGQQFASRPVIDSVRFAFYVDVSKHTSSDAEAFLRRVKRQFKKKKFVNPSTSRLDMRFNPLSDDEDFWFPQRGSGPRVESL